MKPGVRISGAALATVLGSGYSPLAPGTVGSIVAAALYWLVRTNLPSWVAHLSIILILPLALWGCSVGFRLWGDDPARVNVDEFAGCWIACMAVPVAWGIPGIAASLAVFRFFDILKPWPVSLFDRMKTPAGILLDDLAAGLMSAALTGIGVLISARML
jgi:phosphatidylglycerophosphatase A